MKILKNLHLNWEITIIVSAIIICAFILNRLIRWLINKSLSEEINSPVNTSRYTFYKNSASIIIWIIALAAIISLIPKLKHLAMTLFAGAGIFMAILGFAAQQAFSNIVSGIFIVIFKPFKIGDMIQVGSSNYGVVEDITLRHTVINSFENKRIIIPNSVVSAETITNDTIMDLNVCKWIEIGISYESDMQVASKILQEEAVKHPSCLDFRSPEQKAAGDHQVEVRLLSFGDFSVNLRAYVWTNDPFNAVKMQSDILKSIKARFDKEGIEIPYPHRTIVYKKDILKN